MPEVVCGECGRRMFHENQTTLDVEDKIHKKFCRGREGASHSYMHREPGRPEAFDPERQADTDGRPVLKR